MIIGEVKKSGGDAIASITGSGFDPEFPHGTVFALVEVNFGQVAVIIDGSPLYYNNGSEIPYFTTELSTKQPDGKYDHVVPLVRFNRRTMVHVVNLLKTSKEKEEFIKKGHQLADVAHIEICDNVPAPWLPGQGIFQIIREDSTGKYSSLAGYPNEYSTGELRKNYDQRLAAFLKGKKLISDHHVPTEGAWTVFNRWAKPERRLSIYSNGLQYFRLVPTMKDKTDNTPAWQDLIGSNATLWEDLFEAGSRWEDAKNAEFRKLYGGF